jgi:hypothetical protein
MNCARSTTAKSVRSEANVNQPAAEYCSSKCRQRAAAVTDTDTEPKIRNAATVMTLDRTDFRIRKTSRGYTISQRIGSGSERLADTGARWAPIAPAIRHHATRKDAQAFIDTTLIAQDVRNQPARRRRGRTMNSESEKEPARPRSISVADLIAEIERDIAADEKAREEEAAREAARKKPLPERGAILQVAETPLFARVRVTKLGSFNTIDDDSELLGATVIMWTHEETPNNPFAKNVGVRGVLTPENKAAWEAAKRSWLSADGEVELIDPPTYAGRPDRLLAARGGVKPSKRVAAIMDSDWSPNAPSSLYMALVLAILEAPVDTALELILCALKVAPPFAYMQAFLLSNLKALHEEHVKDGFWDAPWLHAAGPDWLNGEASAVDRDGRVGTDFLVGRF